MAAIGGLGYVGVVYEITYKLVRHFTRRTTARPLGVQTSLTKYKTYEHLAENLVHEAHAMRHRDVPEGMTLAEDSR